MPATVTGIYTVFVVLIGMLYQDLNLLSTIRNRIINCDPKVIQTRLNLLALKD